MPTTAGATQWSHSSPAEHPRPLKRYSLRALLGSRRQSGEVASVCLEAAGRGTSSRSSGEDVPSNTFSYLRTPLSPAPSSSATWAFSGWPQRTRFFFLSNLTISKSLPQTQINLKGNFLKLWPNLTPYLAVLRGSPKPLSMKTQSSFCFRSNKEKKSTPTGRLGTWSEHKIWETLFSF